MKTLPKFLLPAVLGVILTACGGTSGGITAVGTWGGSELQTFQKIADGAKVQVKFETTRDLDALLTAKIKSGNLPDIAILPNPAKLKDLARQGVIKPLAFLDTNALGASYTSGWIDLGSYGGSLYGIFIKAANKSVIWYNPEEFGKNGWKIPQTWEELTALTKKIRDSGKKPWSIGADIGWPLTDWIENIMAGKEGPEIYRKWVNHEIPWTDPAVKDAFTAWGGIVGNPANLSGGVDGSLAATFQNAAFAVFSSPPKAYLYYEGDFMYGIIASQMSNVVFGKNIDFFRFPVLDKRYGNPMVVGADAIVVFHDKPQVRKFISWLISKDAGTIAAGSGFLSPIKLVPPETYKDEAYRKSFSMMSGAETVLFDGSDTMPPAVGNQGGFWDACKRYLENTNKLDAVLGDMEKLAAQNY